MRLAGVIRLGLAGLFLLNACGSSQVKTGTLGKESTFGEITRGYGESLCMFSYVWSGMKYDLVTFKDSPSLAIFENGVLYSVLPKTSSPTSQWQECLKTALEKEPLPLGDQGLDTINAWVKTSREKYGIPTKLDGHTAGTLDEIGAAALVAVTWPIWLCLYLSDATDRMITKKDREKFAKVNESLLKSGRDYQPFLATLPEPDSRLSDKNRSIRTFPIGKPWRFGYCYIAGTTDGHIKWVSCNESRILTKILDYQKKNSAPSGKP